MLIQNRSGRIVEVNEDHGLSMIANGEATRVDQTPPKPTPLPIVVVTPEEEAKKPLISVIVPCRVGEENDSEATLLKQTYPNIEIIVVTDDENKGAPFCRNKGFDLSKGEFVLFSDNDLQWAEDAIERLYLALMNDPNASYSYGSYTLEGKLIGHLEFDEEKLRDANYISTMSLIRRADFERFDETLKKFQDWDLWLTLLDKNKYGVFCGACVFSTKVREGITFGKNALDGNQARDIVLKKHAIANPLGKKLIRKLADIIIPHADRHDLLKVVLDAINYKNYNIIVVAGGTFAENCNKGAKIAETENLIFMNDDIEPRDDVIRAMLASKGDICGASQITPSWHPEKIWHGIEYEPRSGGIAVNESMTDVLEKVTIPTGFLLRFKKSVFEALGGFDEAYKNGGEDQEIALQALERGYTLDIVTIPTIHHHSSSKGRFDDTAKNRALVDSRWSPQRLNAIIQKKSPSQMLWLKIEDTKPMVKPDTKPSMVSMEINIPKEVPEPAPIAPQVAPRVAPPLFKPSGVLQPIVGNFSLESLHPELAELQAQPSPAPSPEPSPVENPAPTEVAPTEAPLETPPIKRAGRPKGSLNKPKKGKRSK